MNRILAGSLISVVLLAQAGCGGGSTTSAVASGSGAAAGPTASAAPTGTGAVSIAIAPATGTRNVSPKATVTVAANGGKLTEVRVQDYTGQDLAGALTPDGMQWRATAPVKVGTSYSVDAWAAGADGNQVEKTSSFATKSVSHSKTLDVADVVPKDGATVGVAQPLVVTFDAPVTDRKIVQAALVVTTTPHVDGAWYWFDDTHVHFRPQNFWPENTKVQLNAKLARIAAGGGVLGGKDKTSGFTVGRNQEIHVDTKAHQLTVQRDGQTVKTFDASTGKPGWETRNGTEVMTDKVGRKHWTNTQIDAKQHYSLYSKYAIRITDSGEFVHDAPWEGNKLGEANASHGCVGLKTADMKWIWDNSMVGDPVVVAGTSNSHQDLWNTYDDWNVDWGTWSRGNA